MCQRNQRLETEVSENPSFQTKEFTINGAVRSTSLAVRTNLGVPRVPAATLKREKEIWNAVTDPV